MSDKNQIELTQIMADERYSSGVRAVAAAEFVKRNIMLVENGAVKAASGIKVFINIAKKAMNTEESVKASKALLYGREEKILLVFTKGNNKSTLTKHLADWSRVW
ncbi:hypothetical protein [Paenibacillus sp. 22594]|uniref:hypothetical protein n=1 Tax=Paenibacillus sp. 22594 TaxID=3453947 RepID=UPI003F8503ED